MAWRLVVNVSHAILFGLLSYIVGGFPFLLNSISRTGHINAYQQVREVERFAQPVFAISSHRFSDARSTTGLDAWDGDWPVRRRRPLCSLL